MSEAKKETGKDAENKFRVSAPQLSLPKGGGAIHGIGEKFTANPVTGTGSMSVPIFVSPGRSGFGPVLSLNYDSGHGNGPFGLGWNLSLPSITRRTDKGLPCYCDADGSDTFILSGAEDLVRSKIDVVLSPRTVNGIVYQIDCYRSRVEGLFARIERWTNIKDATEVFWRSISKDNITSWYGKTSESRIMDPADPSRIFSWLICESYDDKGNVMVYGYKPENSDGINLSQSNESNRTELSRSANRYLKRIRYGNRLPYFPEISATGPWSAPPAIGNTAAGKSWPDCGQDWFFELVFDYGEHDKTVPLPLLESNPWEIRHDPQSAYRSRFEVRTYRRCKRVLMFHHFADETDVGENCLVRSTDFRYSEPPPTNSLNPIYSFLISISQTGYKRSDTIYLSKTLPPVEFEYSLPIIDENVLDVPPDSLENLPSGLGDSRYQWIDLDSEGLSGLLTEQAGGWYYKPNWSAANIDLIKNTLQPQFGPTQALKRIPSLAALGSGRQQLVSLAGNGHLDLVEYDSPTPGFFERNDADGWEDFTPFESLPELNWNNPNLKFVDLTGDGFPDLLISEDEAFWWHISLAKAGYGPAQRVQQSLDEEKGPKLIFTDSSESIFLADLSGDGLTDLVRIRNGEACYWPNMGYGDFGAKVNLDNAPWFEEPDLFDGRRIRLADIDGSGTNDIIYFASKSIKLYFNLSGNALSTVQELSSFPAVDSVSTATALDLLGNGTACLVWSSALPGNTTCPMRYIKLMGGNKPHLLTKVNNNLGAETLIDYAPSTKFYIQDKLAGKPWVTRLPFPIHVVEKVTVIDRWRNTRFSSSYTYHHGYYDGVEREFRGFGRVEQVDVESYGEFSGANATSPYITSNKTLYQPPIKTISWYHTGVFFDEQNILSHYESEYFPHWLEERYSGQVKMVGGFTENPLPQPDLAAQNLTTEEWREALRACKGMLLRQEVVELDVAALESAQNPEQLPVKLYSTAYYNCHIQCLQPKDKNKYAVFLVAESEAITYHYELDIRVDQLQALSPDPRIAHSLNLTIDEQAHVLQAVAVVYPRRGIYADSTLNAEQLNRINAVQQEMHLAYTESQYTQDLITESIGGLWKNLDTHRLRAVCEVITYELTGIKPLAGYFTLSELKSYQLSKRYQPSPDPALKPVTEIAYQQLPQDVPEKRQVEHLRSLYFKDDLSGPLQFAELGKLGLTYENYKLALTDNLLDVVFKDVAGNKLDQSINGATTVRDTLKNSSVSGYLNGALLAARFNDLDTTGQYWIRSGIAGFVADAAQHFYLPERYTDPFDNITTIQFDSRDLFVVSSTDMLQNKSEVTHFDFRVLAPREMRDINENLSEVYFDILGLPTAMAAKGKGTEGDNLTGFNDALANPSEDQLRAFFVDSKPFDESQARTWLGSTTVRHVYYFGEIINPDGGITWGQHPACACDIVRERHVSQLSPGETSPIQTAFEYSNGMGSVVVKKLQAEPERAGAPLRWIANGKTILNNKGKPVKQYEPYFSVDVLGQPNHHYEEPKEEGVTPIIYYDAAGRTVRTEMPDGSYSRVEFSPWHVRSFDPNDTAFDTDPSKQSDWYQRRMNPAHPLFATFNTLENSRAAKAVEKHANTPILTLLDSLGRDVISIAHNKFIDNAGVLKGEKYLTYTKLDAEGKPLWIRDARKNLAMQYITPPVPNNQAADPVDEFAPCYDIAGNLLFQHSMDAGDRWMLNDAADKPMLVWDYNDRQDEAGAVFAENRLYFTEYDELHRPKAHWLVINGGDRQMIERFEYIDTKGGIIADADKRNLRGQLHKHYDASGLKQVERLDFKGNPLELRRQLAKAFKATVIDWQPGAATAVLETEAFAQLTEYDALNRMTRLYNWHNTTPGSRVAVYEPQYSRRGLLVDETIVIRAIKTETGYNEGPQAQRRTAIQGIEYNVKGQKERIQYGNGTVTRYEYDPETFRLRQLRTTRPGFEKTLPQTPSGLKDDKVLQNLYYTYDPVGNITEILDDAYEPVFFQNQKVEPISRYTYDALYRLIQANGRESGAASGIPQQFSEKVKIVSFPVTDPGALRNYRQDYVYDAVGNITEINHSAGLIGIPKRTYVYAADSNRLLSTTPGDAVNKTTTYRYDPHGNMLNVANVAPGQSMRWDYRDMIHFLDIEGGGVAYYNYDANKQRTRKRLERLGGTIEERIDLGGLEIYRKFTGGVLVEEIESVHVFEGQQRILLIDDVLQTDNAKLKTGSLYRYQHSNHLGSTALELDDQAQIITYEEYHPYGTTAYQAARSNTGTPKRYRYTGKERDEETGFSYHGARYYAGWLGRWVSCDPLCVAGSRATERQATKSQKDEKAGRSADLGDARKSSDDRAKSHEKLRHRKWLVLSDGMFIYANDNPIRFVDTDGMQPSPAELAQLIQQRGNELIQFMGTHHGFLRGTFEATLAEAQGAQLTGSAGQTFQHFQSMQQAASGLATRQGELTQLLQTLQRADPAAARDIGDAMRPALARSRELLTLAQETERIVIELNNTGNTGRLGGVPLDTGRDAARLASAQLNQMRLSLVPNAIASGFQSTMDKIRQLPITLSDLRDKARDVGAAVGAGFTALRSAAATAGRSAAARFFGAALEFLGAFGSRLVTPLIIIVPFPGGAPSEA